MIRIYNELLPLNDNNEVPNEGSALWGEISRLLKVRDFIRDNLKFLSFVKLFKRHSPPISCCCCCCCSVCETLSSSSSSSCPFYNLVLSDVNTNSSSERLCVVFSDSFSFCCYSSSTSRVILINNLSLFFKYKKM